MNGVAAQMEGADVAGFGNADFGHGGARGAQAVVGMAGHKFGIRLRKGGILSVTYDKESHEVTVEVVDNGQGQLEATVTSEKPVFVNDYAAKPGKVRIQATKVLEGKALEAGKYEFELKDSEGNLIDTAKNAADGSITFKDIEQNAEGTYSYLVSEKAGNEAG